MRQVARQWSRMAGTLNTLAMRAPAFQQSVSQKANVEVGPRVDLDSSREPVARRRRVKWLHPFSEAELEVVDCLAG